MSTQFYQDRFERRLPITGLFLERLGRTVEGLRDRGDDLTEALLVGLVTQCLKECGLVEEAQEEDVVYVIQQLEELYKDNEETEEVSSPSGKGKNFAGYLAEWAYGLSYDKLCLYIADFDYTRAQQYYESLDQRSIVAIADEKLRLDFEKARVSFEASLFGFGGSYKATPKEGEVDFDLTQDSSAAERALKNLGF